MALQAYFDGGPTKGGGYALAGYVATPAQWERFSAEWKTLLKATYPERRRQRFRMTEMALQMDGVPPFYELIATHIPVAVSAAIDARSAACAQSRIWSDNAQIIWAPSSVLGATILPSLLWTLFDVVMSDPRATELLGGRASVDVYLDSAARMSWLGENWGDAVADLPRNARALVGVGPTFIDGVKSVPLQAANFWSWWVGNALDDDVLRRIEAGDFGSWSGKPIRSIHTSPSEDQLVGALLRHLRRRSAVMPQFNFYDAKLRPRDANVVPPRELKSRASFLNVLQEGAERLRKPPRL